MITYFYREILCNRETSPLPDFMFPPTVENSDWYRNIVKFRDENLNKTYIEESDSITTTFTAKFNNIDELNNFLTTYTLTDPALIEDLRLWRQSRGITVSVTVTSDDGTPLSVNPIF